jgi:hypothetical protein
MTSKPMYVLNLSMYNVKQINSCSTLDGDSPAMEQMLVLATGLEAFVHGNRLAKEEHIQKVGQNCILDDQKAKLHR